VRDADLAADGGDVDDAAVAPLAHRRQHGERHVKRPPEMRLHGRFVIFERHHLHRPDLNDARVVDQHVNPPEVLAHAADGLVPPCLSRRIARP
jgi:hypothetical protein